MRCFDCTPRLFECCQLQMSEHAYVVKYLGSVPVAAAKLTATMWDLFGKEVGQLQACEYMCMCMSMCACPHVFVCVCACVCVRVRVTCAIACAVACAERFGAGDCQCWSTLEGAEAQAHRSDAECLLQWRQGE